MRLLLAWLLLGCLPAAFAADCTPAFYNAEPRDGEWFYAAGKGADAAAARADAVRRLAIKATGTEAAASDGTLAGWEQDDHGRCDGASYALIRIEQESVRRNLAAKKKAEPAPAEPRVAQVITTNNFDNRVNNNIVVAPPERHYALVAIFLGFLLACLTFVYRPTSAVSFFYRPPGAAVAPAVVTGRWLKTRYKPVARQPQREAVDEVARLGLPKYFRVHRGEGTCHPIAGSADLLLAGIKEQLRAYVAGGWEMTVEDDAVFAVLARANFVMGIAFFLYGSDTRGSTDCEILYAISSPVEDSLRAQQEEALHTALPWSVQAAAGKMGAANSG